jgi:hypothetical protein
MYFLSIYKESSARGVKDLLANSRDLNLRLIFTEEYRVQQQNGKVCLLFESLLLLTNNAC